MPGGGIPSITPTHPPTQGGNTHTPCLRHWACSVGHLPFKLQRYLGAGKAMQGVGLSSHYTALSPLAAFQKIQTCSKVRNKLLVFPWHLCYHISGLHNLVVLGGRHSSVSLRWMLSHSCSPPPDVSVEKLRLQMEKREADANKRPVMILAISHL